jgi:hypothetical protein
MVFTEWDNKYMIKLYSLTEGDTTKACKLFEKRRGKSVSSPTIRSRWFKHCPDYTINHRSGNRKSIGDLWKKEYSISYLLQRAEELGLDVDGLPKKVHPGTSPRNFTEQKFRDLHEICDGDLTLMLQKAKEQYGHEYSSTYFRKKCNKLKIPYNNEPKIRLIEEGDILVAE